MKMVALEIADGKSTPVYVNPEMVVSVMPRSAITSLVTFCVSAGDQAYWVAVNGTVEDVVSRLQSAR